MAANWCKFCGDPVYDEGENTCRICYHYHNAPIEVYRGKPGIQWHRGWTLNLLTFLVVLFVVIAVWEWAK